MALRIIIDVLFVIGLFFALAGTVGVLKMPDTFCRMQAATCDSTLGMLCIMTGAVLYAVFVMGSTAAAVKIAFIALLIFLTNPIGSHVLAKGAYKNGVRPEKPMETDDYGRDHNA